MCDLPPMLDLQSLREATGDVLRDLYPKFRQQLIQEHVVTKDCDAPPEIRVGQVRGAMQFTLRQSLEAWRFHQNLMTDCGQQIATRVNALEDRGAGPPPVSGKKVNKPQEEPMREPLCEKFGVDLTAAAHKLARILWAMVKHRRPYDPSRLGNPELVRLRKERYLRRQA